MLDEEGEQEGRGGEGGGEEEEGEKEVRRSKIMVYSGLD